MLSIKRSTSKVKETFMGFKLSTARAIPPAGSTRGGSSKAKLPVFEDQKAKVIEKLKISIEEANGRYGSPEQEAAPLEKAIRSKNWTVRTKAEQLMDEQCEVTVRVGQALWECFEEDPAVKDSTKRYLVHADMLVPVLQELVSMVEGLEKDSPEGLSFHALAVEAAGRRNKKTYDAESDMFV